MNSRQLRIECEDSDGVRYVKVSGELDLATVGELRGALDDCTDCPAVVVDTTDLAFIDSTGLHLLVEGRAQLNGFRLVAGESTQRLLTLTGLREFFELATPSTDDS